MKFRSSIYFVIIFVLSASHFAQAQIFSAVGQFTNSTNESFAGGISGDGRFVVFESRGDLATENPRNADRNNEIFLFDYAQRRIFQITDTKSVLINPAGSVAFDNIRVEITNTRPVISRDGRWIAFSSNATVAYPGDPGANPPVPPVVSTTNPGSFNGNSFTAATPAPGPSPSPSPSPGDNPLTRDANLEMWLYQIPAYAPVADLSAGDEIPFVELTGGTFTRVTNTLPSQLPRAATTISGAFIASDNHDATINQDGSVVAFVSTRNLVPCIGNAGPQDVPAPSTREDNDEIFTFVRSGAQACAGVGDPGLRQVTKTPRGTVGSPIYNATPTISANGQRVVFSSNADKPIVGMTTGNNPSTSRNEEIFVSDLADGAPAALKRQLTETTPTNPGDVVNVLDYGRRMSWDGRFVAFDSYADLANEHGGANQTSFAVYLYDLANLTDSSPIPTPRRVGPRSTADSAAAGGDVQHYPGFTDNDLDGTPATLVMETRQNIKSDGTIPTTESEGLNPTAGRPTQLYAYPLDTTPSAARFTRLTKFPLSNTFVASTQPITSDSLRRITFNLALTELGTGNLDLQSEVYYLLVPPTINETAINVHYATGASRQAVSLTPVPTPAPTATPSGSPSPSPTPQTPPAVYGLSPGSLAIMGFDAGIDQPVTARIAVGSNSRSFPLPIELSGLTMTINGAAVGLKSVSRHQIIFVVPPGLASSVEGTSYDVVINNNGTVMRDTIKIVPARPDIFTFQGTAPGGRAQVYNVTNRVRTTEPFTVTTVQLRGGRRVPSRLRIYLTGVANATPAVVTVRVGSANIQPLTNAVPAEEPGVYTIDFALPANLNDAGDVPIVVSVTVNGVTFSSRLDDTAPRIFIL